MIYVNIPDSEFKKSEKSKLRNGVQWWYARFNEVSTDGITHAVEHEIDHKPTTADYEALKASWLSSNKNWQKLNAQNYAKSPAIKGFIVNGNQVAWLESESRDSIRNSIADKKASGRTETTVFLSDGGHTMPISTAEELFHTIEMYAADCFETTENHKSAIDALTDVSSVESYDYTANYPTMPSFTL